MEVDRNGLEVLGRQECLSLLNGATFGRIAFTSRALPVILPVVYSVVGEVLVFRTGPGSKLDAAVNHSVVAFEVDDISDDGMSGWNVLVTGMAEHVDPNDLAYEAATVRSPVWGGGGHLVQLGTQFIEGRRLRTASALRWSGTMAGIWDNFLP